MEGLVMPRRLLLSLVAVLLASTQVSAGAHDATTGTAIGGTQLIIYQATVVEDGIFVMGADGSDPIELAGDVDGAHLHPDWSPDGARVVFEVLHGEEGALWTVGVDGSDPTLLLACDVPCFRIEYPAWSPDGSKIAFTSIEDLGGELNPPDAAAIQVLDLKTMAVTTVVRTTFPTLTDGPRWSPDGETLVVGVDYLDPNANELGSAIATVPATGGELQVLTDPTLFAYYPDWNRTGDAIVFDTETLQFAADPPPDARTWNLHAVAQDGSGLRQITDVSEGVQLWQPTWTPDGQRIVATMDGPGGRVAVFVDPASGDVHPIAKHLATHARLQPRGS
jgi:Tol biopolymer transport system component